MADTLKYNEPGTGPAVATDDVGGVHYQRMKLDLGGDGLAAPILGWPSMTDGHAGAGVLPVAPMLMNAAGTIDRARNGIGTHANAWSAASVAAQGLSNIIEVSYGAVVTIFGTSATLGADFRVRLSQNGVAFVETLLVAPRDPSGNHYFTFDCGARFLQLRATHATGTITITATIAAKGI
jgi:hypothetical protein